MRIRDFEKAIEALGVNGLEIVRVKLTAKTGGEVRGVYGRVGEKTFLWWDASGRGFSFEVNPELELCSFNHPEYLDYRRDSDFDLVFA